MEVTKHTAPPVKPEPTYTIDVSEEEMRQLYRVLSEASGCYNLYKTVQEAVGAAVGSKTYGGRGW